MGDTGLDWLHCMFKDSAISGPGSGPFLREADTGFLYWVNTAHRKVVYYRQVIDNVDENGHGTHCAGSAVGSIQSGGFQTPLAAALYRVSWYCHSQLVLPLQYTSGHQRRQQCGLCNLEQRCSGRWHRAIKSAIKVNGHGAFVHLSCSARALTA